jgi:hypothetical protein
MALPVITPPSRPAAHDTITAGATPCLGAGSFNRSDRGGSSHA